VLDTNTTLAGPTNVFVDHAGDLLISDIGSNLLLRVDLQTNYMYTLAGGATTPSCATITDLLGDGCFGLQARFNNIFASKDDGFGNIFLVDAGNNLIRKLSLGTTFPQTGVGSSVSQTIDIYASAGTPSFTVAPSTDFQLSSPATCTSNADGSSDCLLTINFTPVAGGLRAATILVTNADSTTSNVAVQGYGSAATLSVDPGLATSLPGVTNPGQLARDSSGAIYVGDTGGNVVRKFAAGSAAGVVVAGNGSAGYSGDGGYAANATLSAPQSVAVDVAGNLYVADTGNNVIRKITYPMGTISTIVGGASANCSSSLDVYGDGCSATQAMLSGPLGVAVDTAGDVFIADTGHNLVREVQLQSGNIYVIAGGTSNVCSASTDALGDGCFGTQSTLAAPSGLAIDPSFNLTIADSGSNMVRRIGIVGGIIAVVAGNTQAGFSGDGGAATAAALSNPTGVALDDGLNLAIADTGNNAVRFVSSSAGTISTLAGNGSSGSGGTNASATALAFNAPRGVSFDDTGNLYFTDSANNQLESVSRNTGAVAFGALNIGSASPERQLTLTSTGAAAVTLNSPYYIVGGTDPGDFVLTDSSSNACAPGPLADGAACSINLTFTPSVLGPRSATLTFSSSVANTVTAQLSGTGASLTPTTTAVALVSPSASAPFGSNVPVTATVAAQSGTTTPGGQVVFTLNGQAQPPSAITNGVATLTLTQPAPAAYSISAAYQGDGTNFAPSISALNVNVTITQASTAITLAASPTTVGIAQTSTLTATVTSNSGLTPAGSVSFYNGTTLIGSATLNASGVATTSFKPGTVGTYSLTATYAQSADFTTSTSQAVTVSTVAPGFNVTVNPSSLTVSSGSSPTAQVTLTPVGGFAGTVSLSCLNLPSNVRCNFATGQFVFTSTSSAATTTITVTDGSPLLSSVHSDGKSIFLALAMPGLLALAFAQRRRKFMPILSAGLLACIGWAVSGCSSGSTPADIFKGTAMVNVYASSVGSSITVNQQAALQITVQ
jgi:sugar lactone lactonase YvrE